MSRAGELVIATFCVCVSCVPCVSCVQISSENPTRSIVPDVEPMTVVGSLTKNFADVLLRNPASLLVAIYYLRIFGDATIRKATFLTYF